MHFRDEVHIAKNGPADQWNLKVYVAREDTCLQSSVARLVCTACCTLEQTNILAKPFRFLYLSRIAMMILVFLLLSACAACHTCEDPAFERITSTTIIEKKEVGFSGLLVILENSVRNLAEKQANMTSGMNHSYFNLADSAVGNDAYNHDEEIFLADSRNESNLSNCSLSLQSTPPDTKNYHLYLNTLTPVSPTLVADRYLGPSATTTPSITSTTSDLCPAPVG